MIVFLLTVGLVGCGSDGEDASPKVPDVTEDASTTVPDVTEDASPKMPDVTGIRLDVAKSDIERAGFDEEIEVIGGGTFGVANESAWVVCEQLPAKGEAIGDSPRLTVDRSCGDDEDGDADEPADTTSPDTTAQPAEEEKAEEEVAPAPAPTGIDAQAMEAAFIAGLDHPITDMCASTMDDPTWTSGPHWACFYDGVEAAPGFLRINLTTDGGYAPEELVEMANDTGRAWFNFIGCEFPNLDMIVVTINGLDHNVPRSSTKADLLCN